MYKLSANAPLIMGILNVTEDSFYDGGRYLSEEAVRRRAAQILAEGGDIVDIGAMSTRPDAMEIPEEEEKTRIVQAVRCIREDFPDAVLSVDTYRASVAEAAVEAGADIINDISGGTFDPEMIPTIGRLQVPYVLMHTPFSARCCSFSGNRSPFCIGTPSTTSSSTQASVSARPSNRTTS